MNATFSKRVCVFFFATLIFSEHSLALKPVLRNVVLLSHSLSILGGLGLFTAATLDVISAQHNRTDLDPVRSQVAASSLLTFGIGAALGIVISEMSRPKLMHRMDEIAMGMTSFGFALVSAGIGTSSSNAMLAGTVTVSSFFASRALLLPILIQQNPENFRASDKFLLGALTVVGNTGGLLLTWSIFETSSYGRQLREAGWYILGIINPIVFAGLTVNLFRLPQNAAVPQV